MLFKQSKATTSRRNLEGTERYVRDTCQTPGAHSQVAGAVEIPAQLVSAYIWVVTVGAAEQMSMPIKGSPETEARQYI